MLYNRKHICFHFISLHSSYSSFCLQQQWSNAKDRVFLIKIAWLALGIQFSHRELVSYEEELILDQAVVAVDIEIIC